MRRPSTSQRLTKQCARRERIIDGMRLVGVPDG
jgi:hypothetical protein